VFERNAGGADHWGQATKRAAADAAAGNLFGKRARMPISGNPLKFG
jgi:hypothetical protein